MRTEAQKARHREYQRVYREKNRVKILAKERITKRPPRNEVQRDWRRRNPDKVRAYQAAIHIAHPEKRRNGYLKKTYGITIEKYKEMLAAQNFCCAICKNTTTGTTRNWHIDHCHLTGVLRGLLCHHCNLMLGNAKDNPSTLRAAIEYLERAARPKLVEEAA